MSEKKKFLFEYRAKVVLKKDRFAKDLESEMLLLLEKYEQKKPVSD